MDENITDSSQGNFEYNMSISIGFYDFEDFGITSVVYENNVATKRIATLCGVIFLVQLCNFLWYKIIRLKKKNYMQIITKLLISH